MNWILENISTIIISFVLLIIFYFIIRGQLRKRKNHETSCGSSCAGCALAESCHSKKNGKPV